jgi:uncharacterized protein (TIGR03435 family)
MTRQSFVSLSLLAVGTTAVLVAQTPTPSFDVASVKKFGPGSVRGGVPSRQADGAFDRSWTTVPALIEFAFEIPEYQVIGGPDWLRKSSFEVHARGDKTASLAQIRLMVQSLLRERFMLRTHTEQREMPTYALSVARADGRLGPGLRAASDPTCSKEVRPPQGVPDGAMTARGCSTISKLTTTFLALLMRAPVVDKTGLAGPYEWSFYHSREGLLGIAQPAEPFVDRPVADPGLPSLTSALRDQLGLRMDATRAPVRVLVIDSIQQPTEN